MESMPTELDEISRKIMQYEIEETALNKETDEISKQRLHDIQKEKADLKTKFDSMMAKWKNEKTDRSFALRLPAGGCGAPAFGGGRLKARTPCGP